VIHRILTALHPAGFKRLVFIGDTLLNDGTAFQNICQVGGWDGAAFIASDKWHEPAWMSWQSTDTPGRRLFTANRWALIDEFKHTLSVQDFPIDADTVVVIDIDKTTMGARGRNDPLIDQARLKAAYQTAAELFNGTFDAVEFTRIYNILNQPSYHPVTADNQDFLVYICLFVYAGVPAFNALMDEIHRKAINSFDEFETYLSAHLDLLPDNLKAMRSEFQSILHSGDPTPFKRFREIEFANTIDSARGNGTPPTGANWQEHLVLTAEVLHFAQACREAGATLFALSDKPDEAAVPTPALRAQGYPPLHRVPMLVVGS